MKASKRVPTIIYSIICLVLLVAFLAGLGFLGNRFSNSNHEKNFTEQTSTDGVSDTYSIPKDADKFFITIPFGDVTIQSTNKEPYVTINTDDDIKLKISQKGETCTIDVDTRKLWFVLFSINELDMDIYLPEEMLESVDVRMNAGKLNVSDISSEKFIIKNNAGATEIQNCNSEYFEADVNAGKLSIDTITSSTFEIQNSAGKTDITNCNVEKVKAKVSAGKIDLAVNQNIKSIDANVSAGSMNLTLPKDIKGFELNYDVSAGSFNNHTDFDIGSKNKEPAHEKGNMDYNSTLNECEINVKVSAGSFNLYD